MEDSRNNVNSMLINQKYNSNNNVPNSGAGFNASFNSNK
jgi:hypothetical protein